MLQQALSLSLLILPFIFSGLSGSTGNSNVYFQCSQLNFTSMTPYESNVNSLFTSLVDSASLYNFNKFETSPQSDCVYGLFQCRGDLSSTSCKDCVASSISQLKTVCPMSKGGEIQLEGCFVKYDATSFFGAEDKTEICRNCGPSIGYNSDVLNRIDSALGYLVGGNAQYYRGGDFGSIQGVAQCVQDLSLSDCQDCLSEASGRLRSECQTSTWGEMYLGKCYIRYADQGNLNPENDNGDKRSGKGGRIKKAVLIWSITGSILFTGGAIIALFCAFGNCFNIKEYKKKLKKMKFDKKVAEKERDTAKTETKAAEKERDSAKTETKTTKEKAQKLEKERDSAKTEAKAAKEKAERLEKEIHEQLEKCVPFVPPFPPPCPYPQMLPPPPPCPYLPMPPPCRYLLN